MGAKVGASELGEANLVADVRHLLDSSRRRAQSDR